MFCVSRRRQMARGSIQVRSSALASRLLPFPWADSQPMQPLVSVGLILIYSADAGCRLVFLVCAATTIAAWEWHHVGTPRRMRSFSLATLLLHSHLVISGFGGFCLPVVSINGVPNLKFFIDGLLTDTFTISGG